jgi:hypothetical protein
MIAKFEFNMNEPDDRDAFLRHSKSLDMALCLWKLTRLNLPEKYREKIIEVIDEFKLDVDEMCS